MFLHVILTLMLAIQPAPGNRLTVGSKAIDFTLKTFDGKQVTLSSLRGKVVLLDFWASWCPPCREELPLLDILHKTYGREDFKVLTVNIDNHPKNAVKFLEKYSIKLTPLWDKEKKVVSAYDVRKMPTTILIDKNGWIRYIHSGFETEQFLTYKHQIETLLKEGKTRAGGNGSSGGRPRRLADEGGDSK